MAVGRRCELGCETWPDDIKYTTCPSCGEATKRFRDMAPIDDEAAEQRRQRSIEDRRAQQASEARHKAFEAFYAEHCEELGIPVEGALTVEDVARIPSHA